MLRHAIVLTLLAGAVITGCKCKNDVVIGGEDAGTGTGTGNGDPDGGGGNGDPDGGGGIPDAGDGTTTGGVGAGGFNLDGGTAGGPGGSGDGVKLDPNGFLILNSGEIQLHFAWIANANAGTVSKYDTETGKEVGRYLSVVPRNGLGATITVPGGGNSPSRTAVDLFGDVWVANRAPNIQGTVTKIANDVSSCVDRNGNGVIDTSKDVNGDGMIDPTPGGGEMIIPSDPSNPNQYDECILFSTLVGGAGGGVKARAITISAGGIEGSAGDVWVGIHANNSVIKLKATTGEQVPVNAAGDMEVILTGLTSGPYGAAVDGLQRLWVVDALQARLALVDTKTGTLGGVFTSDKGSGSYGIAIDGKNRVWLAGWQGPNAHRYDHSTGTWERFDFGTAVSQKGTTYGRGRGIAADDQGIIWMSSDHAGGAVAHLIAFNGDTGVIKPFNTPSGPAQFIDATDGDTHTSIGVALDSEGHPWINNQSGNAMRVHRDTGDVLRSTKQGAGLYTYSDFTGYQLRKFTAPRGTYKHIFEACSDLAKWKEAIWDAATPAGTTLQVYVKVANTLAGLDDMSIVRYGPFTQSPVDLAAAGVPMGKYLRIEFVLLSNDGKSSPVLKGFNVKWECGGGIN